MQEEKTMTMQTIKLSQIKTTKANPRKSFDEKSIEGLAQSICKRLV